MPQKRRPRRTSCFCSPARVAAAMMAIWMILAPPDSNRASSDPVVSGHVLRYRWVYLSANFQVQATVDRLKGILDRAHAAGYNGALVSDVKFVRLDDGSLLPIYYTNLQAVLEHARSLGMEVIPTTANFGYSEAILWHNPNLAEGLPVRNATFRALNGHLVPYEEEPVQLANGDFEQLPDNGERFPGWDFQDGTALRVSVVKL